MAKEAPKRVERKPIHSRSLLEVHERPGFHRRWVLDVAGRIQMFKEAGYTFVKNEEDTNTDQVQDPSTMDSSCIRRVGNKALPEHEGRYAYLMEIPLEWWEEDQEAKAAKAVQIEEDNDPRNSAKDYNFGGKLSRE